MRLAHSVFSPFGEPEETLSPVIMLHGMTNSKETWNRLAPKIAELTGRKVYTVDIRNHGDSPWSSDFDYEILTKDIDDFMKEQDLSEAVFVGHSMGGRIAMTLALEKPEKVEKIVVEDMSTGSGPSEIYEFFLQYFAFLRQATTFIAPGLDELTVKQSLVQIIEHMTPMDMRFGNDVDIESKLLNIPIKLNGEGRYTWSANLESIEKALKEGRLSHQLKGQYNGEALFLYGEKSFMKVNEDEEDIKNFFPKAKLVGFDGAGHNIHTYKEQSFLDAIVDFIGK